MNSRIYSWLSTHHYFISAVLILDFIILLNLLLKILINFSVVKLSISKWINKLNNGKNLILKNRLLVYHSKIIKSLYKNYNGVKRSLVQQIILFASTILTNFISVMVYDDYWKFSQIMLGIISVSQVILLIYYFLSSNSKATNTFLKLSLMLGVLNIILTFTHIYFYLFCIRRAGFANFELIGMNSNKLDDWLNCLFYSVSLVIPYSLTELIPNTVLFKFVSLFQIGLFYIFIFNKLKEIIHNHNG